MGTTWVSCDYSYPCDDVDGADEVAHGALSGGRKEGCCLINNALLGACLAWLDDGLLHGLDLQVLPPHRSGRSGLILLALLHHSHLVSSLGVLCKKK